jgi:CRISPR-associated protein Cas1
MRGTKVLEIRQEGYGSLFSTRQGALLFRNKKGEESSYPLFEKEIGAVILKTGGLTSVGALATCSFFGIPVIVTTLRGNPVGLLRSLDDDSYVQTRISQYEATKTNLGTEIARNLIVAKAEGYDQVLRKYGLKPIGFISDEVNAIQAEDNQTLRRKLMSYESKFSRQYFSQIFGLFDERVRPQGRSTFRAYDGLNNVFNLAYSVLRWKVTIAIVKAHLEPYLGFLHSLQYGKPSLILDFMEIFRFLVDDLIISFCKELKPSSFAFKKEKHGTKQAKRQYLNKLMERAFTEKLNALFQSFVEIPRVNVGKKQEVETLINEEALLLAKYLRGERKEWVPRIASLM